MGGAQAQHDFQAAPPTHEREIMNAAEAADFLRLSLSQFKALAAAGEIPRHQIGERRYRYVRRELIEYVLSC